MPLIFSRYQLFISLTWASISSVNCSQLVVDGWQGVRPEKAQKWPRAGPEEAQEGRGVVQLWAAMAVRGRPWAAVKARAALRPNPPFAY